MWKRFCHFYPFCCCIRSYLTQFEFSLLWHFCVRFEYVAEKRRNVSRVMVCGVCGSFYHFHDSNKRAALSRHIVCERTPCRVKQFEANAGEAMQYSMRALMCLLSVWIKWILFITKFMNEFRRLLENNSFIFAVGIIIFVFVAFCLN